MKKHKIIFWVSTTLIFLFEGVMPALTSQTEMAKEGTRHLGYPQYFANALVVAKILGSIVLIIPGLNKRLKEWAYAGFTLEFLFASISNWAVDGMGFGVFMPLIVLGVLLLSYNSYHKLNKTVS